MKQIIFTLLLITWSLCISAQRIARGPLHSPDNPRNEWLLPGDTLYNIKGHNNSPQIYKGKPQRLVVADTLAAPSRQSAPIYEQGLHDGLNLAIDLSAFATMGKHAPHRGGFGQSINAAYCAPLTHDRKLWAAAGIYLNNTNWGCDVLRDIGIYGMLEYRPSAKWELCLYGQLSVSNNYGSLYSLYGLPHWRYYAYNALPYTTQMGYGFAPGANVVGFGARYHFSPSFWVQLNVQGEWYNNTPLFYGDHHRYPTPLP